MGTNPGQDPVEQPELSEPAVNLPPELASLAPEVADDPWEDWSSADEFAPDFSADTPSE